MNIFSKNKRKLIPEIISKSSIALQQKPMNRHLGKILTLAVGAGVLASATGLILYHYLYGRQYVFILERDLHKLSSSLADLRREFEELRNKKIANKKPEPPNRRRSIHDADSGKLSPSQKKLNASNASLLNAYTDGAGSMYSAIETSDEDEFCDISNSPSSTDSESGDRGTVDDRRRREDQRRTSITIDRKKYRAQQQQPTQILFTITPPVVSAATMDHLEAKSEPKTVSAPVDFDKIDQLLEGNDQEKLSAYKTLLQANDEKPNDWQILWRLARASHIVGTLEGTKGDQKGKQQHILKGVDYATKALGLNNNDAKVHKWYAICVGARGQFLSTKEKIQDGYVYKEHVEKAIKLDPNDPTLYNLLGRFEFEVSSLSSMERRVASWLFSEVPKGSIQEAIRNFKKAEHLNKKPWKENRLLLAKCYIHQQEYSDALDWLDKATEVPVVTSEEKGFQEEIDKLLKKYNYYRNSK